MIISSFKKACSLIRKNRCRISIIFVLQVMFFVSLAVILYTTLNPAMAHARNAMEYYERINISEEPDMFNYLGDDPLYAYDNYNDMLRFLRLMAFLSITAFIIIGGLLWALTHDIVSRKSLAQFIAYIINFSILTISFLLLAYLLAFKSLKSSLISMSLSSLELAGALIIIITLIYFLVICYSLIGKRKLKGILKASFSLGIFKGRCIISAFLAGFMTIALFSYIAYLLIEHNMLCLMAALVLLIFAFVFIRLFLIVCAESMIPISAKKSKKAKKKKLLRKL
ncbi:hypothetical protein KY358_02285 [Candidatus Woesearchaeota archaeon]|nr:hypothetical protein [Candidatus Woesearchaeota archaeon]